MFSNQPSTINCWNLVLLGTLTSQTKRVQCDGQRILCNSLPIRNQNEPSLESITCDEKCVVCDEAERERSWSYSSELLQTTPKAKTLVRKIMLCC